jgi:DNA-binding transcriptional regulator YiaG
MMTGKDFQRFRQSFGTQEETARKFDLDVRTIQRWEHADVVPALAEFAIRYVTKGLRKKGERQHVGSQA